MGGRKSKTARQLDKTSHSTSSTKNRPGQILYAQTNKLKFSIKCIMSFCGAIAGLLLTTYLEDAVGRHEAT